MNISFDLLLYVDTPRLGLSNTIDSSLNGSTLCRLKSSNASVMVFCSLSLFLSLSVICNNLLVISLSTYVQNHHTLVLSKIQSPFFKNPLKNILRTIYNLPSLLRQPHYTNFSKIHVSFTSFL